MKSIDETPLLAYLIFVALIPIGTGVVLHYYGLVDVSKPDNILQLLSIAVSTLLTGALIYLYSQQKKVLEKQTELKKAELSGALYVNSHSYDEKSIQVELSNLSGSEISDLKLCTEIFPKDVGGMDIGMRPKRLQRNDGNQTDYGRLAGLAPREQSIEFSGIPSVFYTDEDGSEMLPELTFFVLELRKWGIEEVQCRMWVEGTDQLGETVKSKVFLWDKAIRIDASKSTGNEPTLAEIFRNSPSADIEDSKSEY